MIQRSPDWKYTTEIVNKMNGRFGKTPYRGEKGADVRTWELLSEKHLIENRQSTDAFNKYFNVEKHFYDEWCF